MPSEEEIRRQMEAAADRAAKAATDDLAEEFKALQDATIADLEKLKPKVSDSEAYDKLIVAVKEATAKNESIAEFKNRLQKLGSNVVALAKEVKGLLPPMI